MKTVVLSYKPCWQDDSGAIVTDGGFPYHMAAVAELFEQTTVVIPLRASPPPAGVRPLIGRKLKVRPIPEPVGSDLRRKIALLAWLPRYLPVMWTAVRQADAVHTPVPGDIGTIGLLIALLQRKPLLVRHCGTWGEPVTIADRLLLRLLEKIAGGRNIVFATGGANTPPSRNPNIRWIYSTSISEDEWMQIPQAQAWSPGEELRLITVGRLTSEKNAQVIIDALPVISSFGVRVSLDIVGEGSDRTMLQQRAEQQIGAITNRNNGVMEYRRAEVTEEPKSNYSHTHIIAEFSNSAEVSDRSCIVRFHGNVPHERVLELLSQSHLFVFPTRVKEGFPKALLEAMACGLPSIATQVSVIPELLKDNCGIIINDTSSEGVVNAVMRFVRNPALMREMGRNARAKSQGYTLERWTALIRGVLQEAWRKDGYG